MRYESRFERFEVRNPAGASIAAQFLRAGTLTAGDRPELYFFRLSSGGAGNEEVTVGISGAALDAFQRERRLTREEKIDLAALWLKKQMEAGGPLDSSALLLRIEELQNLSHELGVRMTRQP